MKVQILTIFFIVLVAQSHAAHLGLLPSLGSDAIPPSIPARVLVYDTSDPGVLEDMLEGVINVLSDLIGPVIKTVPQLLDAGLSPTGPIIQVFPNGTQVVVTPVLNAVDKVAGYAVNIVPAEVAANVDRANSKVIALANGASAVETTLYNAEGIAFQFITATNYEMFPLIPYHTHIVT